MKPIHQSSIRRIIQQLIRIDIQPNLLLFLVLAIPSIIILLLLLFNGDNNTEPSAFLLMLMGPVAFWIVASKRVNSNNPMEYASIPMTAKEKFITLIIEANLIPFLFYLAGYLILLISHSHIKFFEVNFSDGASGADRFYNFLGFFLYMYAIPLGVTLFCITMTQNIWRSFLLAFGLFISSLFFISTILELISVIYSRMITVHRFSLSWSSLIINDESYSWIVYLIHIIAFAGCLILYYLSYRAIKHKQFSRR